MEKPINYFFEDTPENREAANKAFEEHCRIFKSPSLYSYSQRNKKESNELQVH